MSASPRFCVDCQLPKPLTEYYEHHGGHRRRCIHCHVAYTVKCRQSRQAKQPTQLPTKAPTITNAQIPPRADRVFKPHKGA